MQQAVPLRFNLRGDTQLAAGRSAGRGHRGTSPSQFILSLAPREIHSTRVHVSQKATFGLRFALPNSMGKSMLSVRRFRRQLRVS
jgi:hypothetical protein